MLFFSDAALTEVPDGRREVRAVWITTVMGLDWPKSYDQEEQRRSLRDIVIKLKESNFNTIFFQVRGRGDAFYRSRYEPWSHQLTGTLGEDPGWDPLAFIIQEAHARCLELHVWFNTFLVKSGGQRPPGSVPQHVILSHPEWLRQMNGEWWFDPGLPEVREYNLNVAMDIVRHYDIDGIQFDFIRYPGKPFPDDETYRTYGGGVAKDEWRRENVNNFLRSFRGAALTVNPALKLGATPIGIYVNLNGMRGQQSYSELYQDSRRWLREGIVDYLAPQVYWPLGSGKRSPDFATIVRDWSENSHGRHIYIGIGAYKPEVASQIPSLIDSTRAAGLAGNAFFRYENISRYLDGGGIYRHMSQIPPMGWKDSIPPLSPLHVRVENAGGGIFSIFWEKPRLAADKENARYFNIYRSGAAPVDVGNPANLVGFISGDNDRFTDTVNRVISSKYYYAVSSLDKSNNESEPAVGSVVVTEIADLAKRFSLKTSIGQTFPDPVSSVLFLPYEISDSVYVNFLLIDEEGVEVMNVVKGFQSPGRYITVGDVSELEKGNYRLIFIAGHNSQERVIRLSD